MRGARWRSTFTARQTSRYSVTATSMARWVAPPGRVPQAARATGCAGRPAVAARLSASAMRPWAACAGALEQQVGHAAQGRGHDHERSGVGGNPLGGAVDGLAVGQRGAAEFPDFERCRACASRESPGEWASERRHRAYRHGRERQGRPPTTPGSRARAQPGRHWRPIRRTVEG